MDILVLISTGFSIATIGFLIGFEVSEVKFRRDQSGRGYTKP